MLGIWPNLACHSLAVETVATWTSLLQEPKTEQNEIVDLGKETISEVLNL